VAVLSTQLWHETFIANFAAPVPLPLTSADVSLHESAGRAVTPEHAGLRI